MRCMRGDMVIEQLKLANRLTSLRSENQCENGAAEEPLLETSDDEPIS